MWLAVKTLMASGWAKAAQAFGFMAGLVVILYSIKKSGRDAEKVEQHERVQKTNRDIRRVPDATDAGTVKRLRNGKF